MGLFPENRSSCTGAARAGWSKRRIQHTLINRIQILNAVCAEDGFMRGENKRRNAEKWIKSAWNENMIMIPQKVSEDAALLCFQTSCVNLYEAFMEDLFADFKIRDELISAVGPLVDSTLCHYCYMMPYIFISWIHGVFELLSQSIKIDLDRITAMELRDCVRTCPGGLRYSSLSEGEQVDPSELLPVYAAWRGAIEYAAELAAGKITGQMKEIRPDFYQAVLDSIRESEALREQEWLAQKSGPAVELSQLRQYRRDPEEVLRQALEYAMACSLFAVAEIHEPAFFHMPILLRELENRTVQEILDTPDMTERKEFIRNIIEYSEKFWKEHGMKNYR